MTVIMIEGKKVKVSDDFKSMPPDEQSRVVEEIASQMQISPTGGSFMGQVNAGIAESVGGLVDFINPFSRDVWQDTALGTGSAVEGLKAGMGAIQADVAEGRPQGVVQSFGRGLGQAAGAVIPVAGAARALQGAGGVTGAVAGQIAGPLATKGGVAVEGLAGGISGASGQMAREAGAPEWAAQSVEMLSPMAIPATGAAARGAVNVARQTPVVGAGIRGAEAIARGMMPMTQEGAFSVAKERIQGLAGGTDRAQEMARRIGGENPLGLTPAQQTDDPNMLGLERAAAAENPEIRDRLIARDAAAREEALAQVPGEGGEVRDAKRFFNDRLKSFKADMTNRVDTALQMGDEGIEAVGPRASEIGNATAMTNRIKAELQAQLQQERALWDAVPVTAKVSVAASRDRAERLASELSRATAEDMPPVIRRLLLDEEGGLGEETTVRELHGLYSKLREVERSARAGTNQQRNTARIAGDVAEAILVDLGAVSGGSPAGRAINEARAFSRALHETFDQGAVGRILKRTIDGDEAMTPEAALSRTVGRGGAQAVADAEKIETAAPGAAEEVTDYLRGRFMDAAMSATGEFTPKQAATWLRQNRELLNRYPDLRAEMTRAVNNRSAAEALSQRAQARIKLADAQSPAARFALGQDEKSVLSIIGANDPSDAARRVMATARKDTTGKAVAGVKAAFRDHLIGKAMTPDGMTGAALSAYLKDKNTLSAMRQVFDGKELARIQRIASDLAKLDASAANVGQVIDAPANGIIDMVVRVAAAKVGGAQGGGTMGGSLQTANIAVNRARSFLRNLTNDRARQLLMDAVEDPELFKALLANPRMIARKDIQSKLAPYLVGGVAAAGTEEDG
jgi:hypothetical protein